MAEDTSQKAVTKKKRSGRGAFVLGLILICLAAVGAVFLISTGVSAVKKLTDKTQLKNEYEAFLKPVVMLDPEPFDDVTRADMEDLLNASILSLLTDENNSPYNYEFVEGEVSGLAISQEEVEKAFKKLFGSEVTPVHQSVECSTCVFEYQSAAGRYVIPITGYDPAYSPRVIDIDKTGEGTVALTVGYIAYSDWEMNSDNDFTQPEPSKYRKITLRESGGSYYVSAIQNADTSALSTASSKVTVATTKPTSQSSTAESTQASQSTSANSKP